MKPSQVAKFLIFGYFATFILVIIAFGVYWYKFRKAPVQPINFSHRLHTTTVGLQCTYCHRYGDKGLTPGVPEVSVCMNCHKSVKVNSPEIIKLTKYWNEKQPVPWIQVHHLPEHVYFPHKRHVRAGVACETCHGDVKGMDRIYQARSLEMGWCVTCHRANKAPTDCWTCHK